MSRLRSKSPPANALSISRPGTPINPIMRYIQELATANSGVRDLRALAASSSAIALSIAAPPHDATDNALDEPGSPTESVWKTAFGAAKIAVNAAKGSSDILTPLIAVLVALSVLINNYDQTTANSVQIREVDMRIQSLGTMLRRPLGDQDGEEKARREVLRKMLAGIVAKLGPLDEPFGLIKFFQNVDHVNVLNGFIREFARAITDYQTSLKQPNHENTKEIHENTKEIHETTKKIEDSAQRVIDAADLEILGKLNPVRNAGYQAGRRDTCLRGTRESVLNGIMRWAKGPPDKHVLWLNGLAGTGKSTIAQTFSEMIAKAGILGASFFCSRDYLDRKELKNIFPTLAYQLACRYPAFRRQIITVIKRNPTVANNSLISQLEDLIIGPLVSSNISCVIVVDALDECIDDQPASAILSVLGRHVKRLLSVKFFITGRPEPRIRTGFRLPLLESLTRVFLRHEVKPSSVDEGIRLYLREKLAAVSKRRSDLDLPDPWPRGEDLTALTKKSSGFFIFVSTLVRFIESESHEPSKRLQLVITQSDSIANEGGAEIDQLYIQILTHAFLEVNESTMFTNLRSVLGAVVLAFNPLSQVEIAGILGLNTTIVTRSLRHLHSVLLVPKEDSKEIRVFHKSFPDFLQNRDRCSDPRFFIDSPAHHGEIALGCLELLKKLKPNPCDLSDFVMNRDVANLPELLEDKVGGAARYACDYWAMHVQSSPTTSDYVIQLLVSATEFFKNNAVQWIEVMSLENRLESVTNSIHNLLDWLGMVEVPVSDLRSLAEDCLRFTMHFSRLMQQSASHIYHSALPLSPGSSTFHSRTAVANTQITEFHGRPDGWGIVMRTITAGSKRFTCMTTFGRRIAAACEDGTVNIYDSITGVLRQSLSPPEPVRTIRGSPDGSIFFCAHETPSITVWDMQTGGLIHTFVVERNPGDIALSMKGRYLACGFPGSYIKVWGVTSKIESPAIWTSSPATQQTAHFCWLEPEEQLAISTGTSVQVWDIVAGTILRSFPTTFPVYHVTYSEKHHQLAIVASSAPETTITFVNPQTGKSTPHQTSQTFSCFTFSQTTEELVCGMETHGLQLFNVSTQRWRHIEHTDAVTSVSSLPNGTIVANTAGAGIRLLNLDGGYAAPEQPTMSFLTVHSIDEGKIIAILSNSRDFIVLLEASTMKQLLKIPVERTHPTPTHTPRVFCASLDKRLAFCSFHEKERWHIQSWGFDDNHPKWTMEVDGPPSIGGISPSGAQIMAYHCVESRNFIRLWDARNGQLKAERQAGRVHPLSITFDSETRFLSRFETYVTSYNVTPPQSTTDPTIGPYLGSVEIQKPRWGSYDVDGTREWVVCEEKRICWIPPEYIGSVQSSYCWAGESLFMIGRDGELRKLTFQKLS